MNEYAIAMGFTIRDKSRYGVRDFVVYHRYVHHVEDVPYMGRGIWIAKDCSWHLCSAKGMDIHKSDLCLG